MNSQPLNFLLFDCYFALLKKHNPNILFFPSAWLNETLLEIKSAKGIKNLKGFAYKKAIKSPWKHALDNIQVPFKQVMLRDKKNFCSPFIPQIFDSN